MKDSELVMPDHVVEFLNQFEMHRTAAGLRKKYQLRAANAVEGVYPILNELKATTADTYLDIGCGTGAPSAFIAIMLKAKHIHLIDGKSEDKVPKEHKAVDRRAGWNDGNFPWNSVEMAKTLVQANVDKDVTVHAHFANCPIDEFEKNSMDFISSFRSWGHHYPVDIYGALVKHCLKPTGMVMLDIRNKTKGIDAMKAAGFAQVKQVPNHSEKCERWIFKHKE